MSLEPLRQAYLARASAAAEATRAQAREDAAALVDAAHKQAQQLLEGAREEGRRNADAETERDRALAERRARAARLGAQRAAYEALEHEVLRQARSLRRGPEYAAWINALEAQARAQLGGQAAVEVDPPAVGGVIASAGRRRVDYTLPALVARSLARLSRNEVESLWR